MNTIASFITNTNWQYYAGESPCRTSRRWRVSRCRTSSRPRSGWRPGRGHPRLRAAFAQRARQLLGRPLSLARLHPAAAGAVLAVFLVSQGVVQTFDGHATAQTLQGRRRHRARPGRVAGGDQAARDERRRLLQLELGGAVREPERAHQLPRAARDSAHPRRPGIHVRTDGRRAPAGVADLLRDVRDVRDRRGDRVAARTARLAGAARIRREPDAGHGQCGGNMQDKEVRFGIAYTALWATATTNASNGRSTAATTRSPPVAAPSRIVNMFTGEVIFGGVGSGLYGMFFYVLIAVFIAGLMVGRTPEYLGKKIEAREIKLAAIGALFVPTMVLVLTALAVVTHAGSPRSSIPARTGSPRRSTPTTRRRTTTAAPSPATARPTSRRCRLGRAVARPVRAADRRARDRRFAGRRRGPSRIRRHLPHRRPDLRRPDRRRRRPDGRPDDLPGALPRPDGGGAVRERTLARSSALAVVAADSRLRASPIRCSSPASRSSSSPTRPRGAWSRSNGRVVGSRLVAQDVHLAALLPLASVGHDARLQRGAPRRSPISGRQTPTSLRPSASAPRRSSKLERPYNPGLTIGDIPVDAVTTSGSGIDPHILRQMPSCRPRASRSVRGLSLARVHRLIESPPTGARSASSASRASTCSSSTSRSTRRRGSR